MIAAKCKCGGSIGLERCFIEGFLAECMRCNKCGETLFTPEQVKQLAKLREANSEIEGKRKIVKVGSSIAALLPKKVEGYGVREGVVDSIRVLSSKSLEIRFNKDIV
ncbi:hypothetical protein HYU12_03195 [Candidatus Woesearchaeota archaeon]|nr:hypothetical protein [Candidatus Woesearchaeota archaeon]